MSAVDQGKHTRETSSPRTQFEKEKQEANEHLPPLEASGSSSPQTCFSIQIFLKFSTTRLIRGNSLVTAIMLLGYTGTIKLKTYYTYLHVCKTRVTIRWNLLERPQMKHKTPLMLMTPFFSPPPPEGAILPFRSVFVHFYGVPGVGFLAVLLGLFLSQQGATGPVKSPPCTCMRSTAKARESQSLCFPSKA